MQLECIYQGRSRRPPRKRRLSGDAFDAQTLRDERKLSHLSSSIPPDVDSFEVAPENDVETIEPMTTTPQIPITRSSCNDSEEHKKFKFMTKPGKSRYINSQLWHGLGEEDMHHMSEDEDEDPAVSSNAIAFPIDPLLTASPGSSKSLLQYYPSEVEGKMLWRTHVDRIEPLCKVLHIPSTSKTVETACQQPNAASKADECVLFAMFHCAVFSMTDNECLTDFGQSRATLLAKYHAAAQQALVNASWLKTTELKILQAFVLLLIPYRYICDPHVFWVLTGVAVRIAQRMGLHHNDKKLDLPPFEVQMRRRLFYQIVHLEGVSGRLSGTGVSIINDKWQAQPPSNINDDQIWPGMAEWAEEQKDATEMIFCLARASLWRFFSKVGDLGGFKDLDEVEAAIKQPEQEFEEKYIRHCDVINPLHFLVVGLARSAITASRRRWRLSKIRDKTATDAQKKEAFELSSKILDTDCAAFAHTALRKYLWFLEAFFPVGAWDALIFILTTLHKRSDLFSAQEIDSAWERLEQIYTNHPEAMKSARAIYVTLVRLTLKAWDVSHASRTQLSEKAFEPEFITALRTTRKKKIQNDQKRNDFDSTTTLNSGWGAADTVPTQISPSSGSDDPLFSNLADGMGLPIGDDLTYFDDAWMYWGQLNNRTGG